MKKRSKIILIGIAAVVCVAVIVLVFSHKQIKPITHELATVVQISPVEVTNIPIIATATGNLAANQSTNISPKAAGYVTAILFKDGQFVKKGALLIKLDSSKEIDDLASAKAEAKMSQLQYDRDVKAYKKGLILQTVVYQDKVTNEKNQALVKTNQTLLSDMSLTAPFTGYLGAKSFSLGDYVTAGQKLVSLVDQQHLKVVYSLPSFYAPKLKVGQSVMITADFLPGVTLPAKVSFIAPSVDPDSQTIQVQAILDNSDNELKPGQFVNVTQTLGTERNAILVPEDSVNADLSGHRVFVVKNNKAVSVPVKIGERFNGKVQIMEGLNAQDQIITKGQLLLKDGSKVKVAQPKRV